MERTGGGEQRDRRGVDRGGGGEEKESRAEEVVTSGSTGLTA